MQNYNRLFVMCPSIDDFLFAVVWQHKIPFEISADPFFSQKNMEHVHRVTAEMVAGKGTVGIGKPEALKGDLSG